MEGGDPMCLAVPGRVVKMWDRHGTPMATVDFDGITREACLAYVPDIEIGDYALVHVGFAIARVDEDAAKPTESAIKPPVELPVQRMEVNVNVNHYGVVDHRHKGGVGLDFGGGLSVAWPEPTAPEVERRR